MLWSTGLVAISHHAKRWMIAVCFHHSPALFVEVFIKGKPFAKFGGLVAPGGTFHVQVEARFIGGGKGCLRWTPRMEPDVVQPMSAADTEDAKPFLCGSRRKAGLRKDGTFKRASQKERFPVDLKLSANSLYFPHSEDGFACVLPGSIFFFQCSCHLVQIGMEFAP